MKGLLGGLFRVSVRDISLLDAWFFSSRNHIFLQENWEEVVRKTPATLATTFRRPGPLQQLVALYPN